MPNLKRLLSAQTFSIFLGSLYQNLSRGCTYELHVETKGNMKVRSRINYYISAFWGPTLLQLSSGVNI